MTRQPTTGFQVAEGWGTRTGVWAGYVSTTPFGVRSVWSLVKPELLLRAQGQPLKPQNRLFSLNRDVQTGITNHHRLVGILLDTYDRKLALASAAHIIKLKQKAYITNNGRRPVSLALGKVGQFCFTRCRHLAKKTDLCQSLPATQHNPRARGNKKNIHPGLFSLLHTWEKLHVRSRAAATALQPVFFWSILFGLKLKLYLERGNCKGKPIQEGPHKYLSDSSLLIQALNKPNKPGLNLL